MESLLSITKMPGSQKTDNFRAYLLESTAQTSVEKKKEAVAVDEDNKPSKRIAEIVQYISDAEEENPNVIINVIIQIHGYNTGKKYIEDYTKAVNEINEIHGRDDLSSDNIVIFLGYAWPSEQIALFNICDALKSLPGWLQFLSLMGLPWIGANILWLGMNTIFPGNFNDFIKIQLDRIQGIWLQILNSSNNLLIFSAEFILNLMFCMTALSSLVTTITLVLILLRSTVYFRDSYRATHYGVPDLVQFFRAFEYLLLEREDQEDRQSPKGTIRDPLFKGNQIKLSFIAHSMGAFVTTNLVRALSDVFDSNDRDDALSIIDGERISSNQKNSNIGKCFFLERLILISPDIPVNAILSGRSNFLRSSLSRFQESHLFSNEGDLVLLLLSTVANYISFPSTTSQMGYKLGNLGVDNEMETIDQYKTCQFTRIERQLDDIHDVGNILNNLVIGVKHDNLIKVGNAQPYMAQGFTYFDCTNFFRSKFFKDDNKKIRNYKKLTISNYARLIFRLPDSHVQYFYERETAKAIYTIACKGFNNFITSEVGREILGEDHPIKVLKDTAEINSQPAQIEYEI